MSTQPGRNEPCPCGSGLKFKKCCGSPATTTAVSPAKHLHDLDDRMVKEISQFGVRRFDDRWRLALSDYPVDEAAFDRVSAHLPLFFQWLCYERKLDGHTVGAHFLEARGRNLLPSERAWLQAQGNGWLSIWEVVDLDPGAWIQLRDLLTGAERRVVEVIGSKELRKNLAILVRMVDHEGLSILSGMHPHALSPPEATQVVSDFLSENRDQFAGKKPTAVELRQGDLGTALIGQWQEEHERTEARPLPRLTNTDREELVMVKDVFTLKGATARDDIDRLLCQDPSVIAPRHAREGYVIESKPAHLGPDDPGTVHGRVNMTTRELRLETNSIERADRLRVWLENLAGARLRHKSRTQKDPVEAAAHSAANPRAGSKLPPGLTGPMADEMIRSFKEKHYGTWIDVPLPALDGLTPREAASIPGMRKRLGILLKDCEEHEDRGPVGQRYDFGPIRRTLGFG